MEEMPYEELLFWFSYLELRPIDWRDDERTYKFLQTQGFKGKPWNAFTSLSAIYKRRPSSEDKKESFLDKLKNSVMFQKMQESKNGDILDFDKIERNSAAPAEYEIAIGARDSE